MIVVSLKYKLHGPSVFAREFVRRRTRFGPLQAKELGSQPSEVPYPGGLEFGLFLEGREPVYMGRGENWEDHCNWMAMVHPARTAEEQNLVAFQYHSGIYFVTTRDIEPNTELRVWYAKEYAYCMGTKPLKSIGCVKTEKDKKDVLRKRQASKGRGGVHGVQVVNSPQAGVSAKVTSSPTKGHSFQGRSLRSEGRLTRLELDWKETSSRTRRGNTGHPEATREALRGSRSSCESVPGKSKKGIKNEENKSAKEITGGDWSLGGRLRSGTKEVPPALEVAKEEVPSPSTVEEKWTESGVEQVTVTGVEGEQELPPQPLPSTSETTPKRHKCAICGKTFGSPGKLAQHSYSHTGERPFGCSDCPKAFSSKFKLERHKLIHTGERRHQCPTCRRSFRRRDHLRNHERVHRSSHGDSAPSDPSTSAAGGSGVSPVLRCDRPQCSREFRSAAAHGRHLAGHAAREGILRCEVCGAGGFARTSDVLRHLREAHVPQTRPSATSGDAEGPRRFPCNDCGRTFFTRKDVRRHLVVHTGRRDFLCQFCPQRFGRKDHLIRHIKKGHGADLESASVGSGEASAASGSMREQTSATSPIVESPHSLENQQCSSTPPAPSSVAISTVEFKPFSGPAELDTLRMEGIGEGRLYEEENRVDLEHLLSLIPPLPSSPSGSEPPSLSRDHSPFNLPPDRGPPLLPPHTLSLLTEDVAGVSQQVLRHSDSTPLPRFDQVFHPQQP
ncbi:hypothetical protein J437_LFUL003368 [Ladona fulva]|uniref:Uncharacterized protein n=1 Tax=Ladona fulva TaxID=123851 RepID=A0A8K0NU13_LADFU|nr:hypothetical protein J437_LFUL003368 [Ladona fulva]